MNPYEAPQNVDEESKPRVATASIPHYRAYFCWWCVMLLLLNAFIVMLLTGHGISLSYALKLVVFSTAITFCVSYAIFHYYAYLLQVISIGCRGIVIMDFLAAILNLPFCIPIYCIMELAKCYDFTNNASNPWNGSIAANGLSKEGAIFVVVLYQTSIFFLQFILGWLLIGIAAVIKLFWGIETDTLEK